MLFRSGKIACTGWVIRSCDSPYVTRISSLAYLCLLVALGILGYSGEFLLNLGLSTLRDSPEFILLRLLVSQLDQSFLVIDLENTVVVC